MRSVGSPCIVFADHVTPSLASTVLSFASLPESPSSIFYLCPVIFDLLSSYRLALSKGKYCFVRCSNVTGRSKITRSKYCSYAGQPTKLTMNYGRAGGYQPNPSPWASGAPPTYGPPQHQQPQHHAPAYGGGYAPSGGYGVGQGYNPAPAPAYGAGPPMGPYHQQGPTGNYNTRNMGGGGGYHSGPPNNRMGNSRVGSALLYSC